MTTAFINKSGTSHSCESRIACESYDTLTLCPVGDEAHFFDIAPVGEDTLYMQGELGRGGMAIVREARQPAVARQVAVKMAHGRVDEMSGEVLRREAYVLGLLDHPNILPIYTFTKQDGQPALVLKKIVGRKWSDYIGNPDLVVVGFGVEDTLEWNLQILLKVLDAIRFAHSRGIIHRDLKPSNVMVGDFGEVILMDWGLAVSTRKSHEGILPQVANLFDIAGTPPYMAPEMLLPESSGVDFQTDVYLLGATLFHVLTGYPPHLADTKEEIYQKIQRSELDFPDDLPGPLRSLCQKAMHKSRRLRFLNMEEFKLAVEEYLRRRGARHLQSRADEILVRMRSQVSGPEDRSRLYNSFGLCKFAFQEALHSWPDNREAKSGLRECTEIMVDYELRCGEPAAAAGLLAEIGVQEGAQYESIAEASRLREVGQVEAAKLRRDADLEIRRSARRTAMTWVGLGWVVTLLLIQIVMPETSYQLQALSHFSFLGLWLTVGKLGNDWIRATSINTRLYKTVLLGTIFAIAINCGSRLMGVPAEQAQVYHLFVFFCCSMITVAMIDWRAWPTAIVFFLGFLVSSMHPELSLFAMAVSNAVLVVNIIPIWSPSAGRSFAEKSYEEMRMM